MTAQEHNEAKSIFEHVGDLRKKILIALGFFLVGAIVAHIFNKEIIAFLLKPAGSQHLIFLSPLEPLIFIFKIDFIGGFIISFPAIMWCLISYIVPAFPKKISNIIVFFFIISTILVFAGLLYAFFIMIPISLKFLFSINVAGIDNNFSMERYLGFLITQAVIILAVFQVPVLIIGGISIGILKTKIFANKRRYIYLGLIIALAIITPTTDVFSLGVIFIPCLAIFEVSLLGGKIVERLKRKNKEVVLLENKEDKNEN